jgi:imidazolonepropionase-like amidohydrolase
MKVWRPNLSWIVFTVMLSLFALPLSAQDARVTVIRAGHLFDSKSGRLLADQTVLVRGDKIADVGPTSAIQVPADANVIDLSHATVLPGLIDGHTHIFDSGHAGLKEPVGGEARDTDLVNDTREYRTLTALANAQRDLRAGFTTLRDLMSHGNGYADVDVKKAINRGLFPGPRLQVSTMGLVATGAGIDGSPEVDLPRKYTSVDDPWTARKLVREQIHYGADWIKIHSTSGYHFQADGHVVIEPGLTAEEIKAIVDEAHRNHHKVACHAFGGDGVRNCIDAGVDTLEHGLDLDEKTADELVRKGIYLELTAFHYYTTDYLPKDMKATGGKNSLAAMREASAKVAIARGVKISFGSGVGPFPHGSQTPEFEYMVRYGMTPAQAIRSATMVAAEMMGWQDRIGSLEKGKFADMIAVSGDPLADITELERVKFVMKGGEVFRNDLR